MTTNTPSRLDAAELRRLHEAATPIPVRTTGKVANHSHEAIEHDGRAPSVLIETDDDFTALFLTDDTPERNVQTIADAELYTMLHNSVPDILALLEENERLREAAQGAHKLLSRHGLGESVENEEWRQATASLATALSERPADGR